MRSARRALRVVVRRSEASRHRCPHCGSWDVARSALGVLDQVARVFGRRP